MSEALNIDDAVANGEESWSSAPAPTLDDFVRSYRSSALREIIEGEEDRELGFVRELEACPRKGRINFKQIAQLRQRKSGVDTRDEDLLICRKPVATGDLDAFDNPIYRHEDHNDDPSDYYQALWGHDYDVYRGKVVGPRHANSWSEGFSDPYPTEAEDEGNGYARRGVEVNENDEGDKYFRIYSSSTSERVYIGTYPNGNPAYETKYYPRATYLTTYVGRIEPGTRLIFNFEAYSSDSSWRGQRGVFSMRGWEEGFMGGDSMDYMQFSISNDRNEFISYTDEFTVDERFSDIWIAFQQNGSSATINYQNLYLRNFQIWRA